jgi:hypothetical protein
MNYTISKLESKIIDNNTYLTGYSFIDELGHCFMIVYGESKRDELDRYLLKKRPIT